MGQRPAGRQAGAEWSRFDVALVAHFGSYPERKQDSAPGNQIMSEGHKGLMLATVEYMVRDRQLAAQANG